MKIKLLFTGFICSTLLIGCQGQDIENEPIIRHYNIHPNDNQNIFNNEEIYEEDEIYLIRI